MALQREAGNTHGERNRLRIRPCAQRIGTRYAWHTRLVRRFASEQISPPLATLLTEVAVIRVGSAHSLPTVEGS